ncbi:MAG: 4Fe-4S binding protein [Bacillota bacterium]|nr:4Fe-4S binding protein [Bacillota bacterium]
MIRKIIKIDEDKCDGCGLCATACHEGAIDIIDGKAKLVREHFCDGLGDCLPSCPQKAITFEEREAPAYDEAAVLESIRLKQEAQAQAQMQTQTQVQAQVQMQPSPQKPSGGCPGMKVLQFPQGQLSQAQFPQAKFPQAQFPQGMMTMNRNTDSEQNPTTEAPSRLGQWPCQIKLVPVNAPFFNGARLLIAADCTAFAYAGMHEEFMKGRITLIGCPKLDSLDYSEKLAEIIGQNDIKSVTVVRMEVPCCAGMQTATEQALRKSGKFLPWQIVTVSRDGRILDRM